MTTKITNLSRGAQQIVAPQKFDLLSQVYALYPLLQGVLRDSEGNYDFEGKRLTNIGNSLDTSTAVTEETNLSFLTAIAKTGNTLQHVTPQGMSCRVASTANVPLSGVLPLGGLIIDGYTYTETQPLAPHGLMDIALGWENVVTTRMNRILLKNQTNLAENGIFDIFVDGGNYELKRAYHDSFSYLMQPGKAYAVMSGTTNKLTMWMVDTSEWDSFDVYTALAVTFKRSSLGSGAPVSLSSGATTTTDIRNKLNQIISALNGA